MKNSLFLSLHCLNNKILTNTQKTSWHVFFEQFWCWSTFFKLSKAQISNYTHKIITPTTPPPTLMNKQQVTEHIIEYLPSWPNLSKNHFLHIKNDENVNTTINSTWTLTCMDLEGHWENWNTNKCLLQSQAHWSVR